jgi:hypothetical protein
MNYQSLPISRIRTDGGTQCRASFDDDVAGEYALDMQKNEKLPPVIVFFDGKAYWLADGFYRLRAHQLIGERHVFADVRQGTQRDAVLFSVGANRAHGLRRTNADKRKAVQVLLQDPEWCAWSNRRIAHQCGVDESLVRTLRAEARGEKRTKNPQTGEDELDLSQLPPDTRAMFNALSEEEKAAVVQLAREEVAEKKRRPPRREDKIQEALGHLERAKATAQEYDVPEAIRYLEAAEQAFRKTSRSARGSRRRSINKNGTRRKSGRA